MFFKITVLKILEISPRFANFSKRFLKNTTELDNMLYLTLHLVFLITEIQIIGSYSPMGQKTSARYQITVLSRQQDILRGCFQDILKDRFLENLNSVYQKR